MADARHYPQSEPIHEWFELTYSNYLVLPRTLLQSMPAEWQQLFVDALEQLRAAYPDLPWPPSYRVHAIDADGRYVHDPVPHYDRGRARLEPKP